MAGINGKDPPKLSAIVLCYRAEEHALPVIEPLYGELSASGLAFELILVANYHAGGGDRTPEVTRAFAEGRPEVKVIAEPKKGAMGWDMRSGFAAATGDVLITIDGDGQNPPGDVLRAYRELQARSADVLKGVRVRRQDGIYRRLLSRGYTLAFQLLFPTREIRDINGKPKAMTRRAYESLELRSNDWFTDTEILLRARDLGLRIVSMPVEFGALVARRSFVGPRTVVEFVRNLVRYRIRGASAVR